MVMKKYADDYETVVTVEESGREIKTAVFRGDYFEIELDKISILKFRRISTLLLFAIGILHISSGFVGNPGTYQFLVSLPYVFAYLPLFYLAIGVLRLPKEKRKLRRDEIGLSFDRVKSAGKLLLGCISFGVIGEIIFIFFISENNQPLLDTIYLAIQIIAAASVYFLLNFQKKIRIIPSQG
jgi:hypothetical protein